MLRILLALPIILCSALSFVQQMLAPNNALERYRRAHCYGWTSPAMAEHWQRLFALEAPFHDAKNVMSEWVRLDPQRAGKLFSFALVLALIGAVL